MGEEQEEGLEETGPEEEYSDEYEEVDEDEFIEALEDQGEDGEDVRATVERAAAALQGELDLEGDEEDGEEEDPSEGASEPVEAFAAPARFSKEARDAWEKTPLAVRKELPRMVSDLQAQYTRKVQQVTGVAKESADILQAVRPFEGEWAKRGVTRAQAISIIASEFQERVTDPAASILKLANRVGIDLFDLADRQHDGSANGAAHHGDANNSPEVQELKNEINSLRSQLSGVNNYVGQQRTAELHSRATSIVEEFKSLRDEKDASGLQRYPATSEPNFLQRAKPLVLALKRTFPELPYRECFRRAYFSLEGPVHGDSGQVNQTGLPPSSTEKPRARAISVRGATQPGPAGLRLPEASEIPSGHAETAAMALQLIKNGQA